MKIQVHHFAAARDATGTDVETLEVEPGTTVEVLLRLLEARHPALADLRGLRLAVDEAFPPSDAEVHDRAVVALIPPVSGG